MRPPMIVRRAAVLLCITFLGCSKKDADDESGGGESATPASVAARTAVVTTQSFTQTLAAIGIVTPRAGHLAALAAPATGRIARVFVTTGQRVGAGQPLIELEPAQFQASAASAEAALTVAQKSYERTQRLANEGIAPRKDVEIAAAEVARARADVVSAQRIAQLSTLRSPIAGVVTRMTASLGAMADPTQTLVEVADPSALDVVLSVTPTDAARIQVGQKVTLTAGQNAAGESLGVATVVDIGATVDTATRSVSVRVQAPTTRRPLRISETVYGQVIVAVRGSAIVVPNESLVPEGDGYKVWVVDGGGVAHARAVEVGGRTASVTEIRSGLVAGERIVTYGAYGVQDSARVVPQDRPQSVETRGSAGTKGGP